MKANIQIQVCMAVERYMAVTTGDGKDREHISGTVEEIVVNYPRTNNEPDTVWYIQVTDSLWSKSKDPRPILAD